ncbi:MAG: hypothetical protein QXK37_04930 [Candidatus Woesearchaeota archaeon]
MHKGLEAILLIILFAFQASSISACETYIDCPERNCIGSIRVCSNGQCIYSQCIIPSAENIKQRENIKGLQESINEYGENLNMTITSKNPESVKYSILRSLGLQRLFLLFLKVLVMVLISFFAALIIMFIKIEGWLKYFAIVACIAVIILVGVFLFAGGGIISAFFAPVTGSSWEGIKPHHFSGRVSSSELNHKQLIEFQNEYISEHVIQGTETTWEMERGEAKLLVLEFDSAQNLNSEEIHGIRLVGEPVKLHGEYMVVSGGDIKTYIFDENRFVFVISAEQSVIDDVSLQIISAYPTAPTRSRLFRVDRVPPIIELESPTPESLTNKNQVVFNVRENGSGVEKRNIKIRGMSGFNAEKYCNGSLFFIKCSFGAKLQQGENLFEISVTDNEDNLQRYAGFFVYDSISSDITLLKPATKYTNSRFLTFQITDASSIKEGSIFSDASGFRADSCSKIADGFLCTFVSELDEGQNSIKVSAEDNAGNLATMEFEFYYDTQPPKIYADSNTIVIEDNIQLDYNSVLIDDRKPSPGSCRNSDGKIVCTGIQFSYIQASDAAGNSAVWST